MLNSPVNGKFKDFSRPLSVFKYFSRHILFSRTFQDSPIYSSTFQACANPGTKLGFKIRHIYELFKLLFPVKIHVLVA